MHKISFKLRMLLFLVSGVLLIVTYLLLISGRKKSEVNIVVRYDDYSSTSSDTLEKEILQAIDENHFSCSFGIIPYSIDSTSSNESFIIPLDSSKIQLIKEAARKGSIEICQHGYLHRKLNQKEPFSEFRGMNSTEQYDKIAAAKRYLETSFSTKVNTFIPPWNTYDKATLYVLKRLNFNTVSADQYETTLTSGSISYVPFTAFLPDIKKLLNYKTLPANNYGTTIVLLLHDYDFVEINPSGGITDIIEFKTILSEIADRKWNMISVGGAVGSGIYDLHHYRLNRFKLDLLDHVKLLSNTIPLFHKLTILNNIYLSGGQTTILILLVLLYYFIIFLIFSEIIHQTIGRISLKKKHRRFYLLTGIVLLALSVSVFWIDDKTIGNHEAMILVLILGFLFSGYNKNNESTTHFPNH